MKKHALSVFAAFAAMAAMAAFFAFTGCDKPAPHLKVASKMKSIYGEQSTSGTSTSEPAPEPEPPPPDKNSSSVKPPAPAPVRPAAVPVVVKTDSPPTPPAVTPAPPPAPPDTPPANTAVVSSGPKVVIKPTMPKPLFAGTPLPQNNPPPNLDKSGKPTLQVEVPEGVTLISKGKTVTSSDPQPLPDASALQFITDGDKQGDDGYFADLMPGKQWVQIDLGATNEIHLLWVWHFHKQAVCYRDVVAQISDDPEFKTATTVYNNDFNGDSGFGTGTDQSWVETNNGRPMPVKGVKGRYVRLWSNGRDIDDTNQYIEIEVYGKPAA